MASANALTRLSQLVVGALVLALLACGCSESSVGALAPSKEGFILQADRICGRADAEQPGDYEAFTARYEEQLEKLGTVGSEATISRDLKLPSAKWQIRKIESLDVPRGEEQRLGSIIARWNALVRQGERNPYRFGVWWNNRDPFIEMKKVAVDYGFKDCEDLR